MLEINVLNYIRENALAWEGSRIGVAVSGGPDSMALLYCFNELKRNNYFDICALHMEHGIRGESSIADSEFVKEQCEALKIPLYVKSADVPAAALKDKLSIETAAKKARESFFKSVIEFGGADYIATAHHASDNAESVLMHIMRGSGLKGIKGIKQKKDYIIRPFLNTGRKDIIEYLEKKQIPFRVDETNKDNSYARNFIRNIIIKQAERVYGNVTGAINRLSRQARQDAEYIDINAEAAFSDSVIIRDSRAEIDLQKLKAYHKAISSRVIIKALDLLGLKYDVEEKHVEALLKIAKTRETGKIIEIIRGFQGRVEYDILAICAKDEKDLNCALSQNCKNTIPANIPGVTILPNGDVAESTIVEDYAKNNADKYTECFDLDKLPNFCAFKKKERGYNSKADKIRPLGAPGSKKLSRYLIDKKIPEKLRYDIPLLADGENIIWIVGYTISDNYKIDENTKRIIRIKYQRKE